MLLPYLTGMTNRIFQDEMTSWPLIAEHCKLMVCFGGITGRTAQITSSGTSFHEVESWLARAHETACALSISRRIVPRSLRGSTPSGSSRVQHRYSADVGYCALLLIEGLHDVAFLDRCTVGWPALETI